MHLPWRDAIWWILFDVTTPPDAVFSIVKLCPEASNPPPRLVFGLSAPGVVAVGLNVSPSSFFCRLSFALLFWNHT